MMKVMPHLLSESLHILSDVIDGKDLYLSQRHCRRQNIKLNISSYLGFVTIFCNFISIIIQIKTSKTFLYYYN
jgi:hypothetical protein